MRGQRSCSATANLALVFHLRHVLKKAKSVLSSLLFTCGWELKRLRTKNEVLYDNPYDALFRGSSLVRVQIKDCTDKLGFNYGEWQPWVETAKQIIEQSPKNIDYQSSVVCRFYEQWSLPLLTDVFSSQISDEKYRNHFLKVFHGNFLPFCDAFPGELEKRIAISTRYLESDNRNAGYRLTVDRSINRDGTWTIEKGKIETERLRKLIDSIQTNGYKRSWQADGDVLAYALERNHTFKYVIVSGLHRIAVLAALGHQTITLRLFRNVVVNRHTISSWPLVKQGVYTPDSALAYFNHMFDFDSRRWAQTHFSLERQTS